MRRNHRAAAPGEERGTDRGAMAADGPHTERGSGVLELPSTPRLVCVEYPGLVRDVSAMLRTLGGEEGVSRVRGCRRPRVREAGWRGGSGRPSAVLGLVGRPSRPWGDVRVWDGTVSSVGGR